MFFESSIDGSSFFAFSELQSIPGFVHAFTSKATDGNPAFSGSKSLEDISEGKEKLFSRLEIPKERTVVLKQIHSDKLVAVDSSFQHSGNRERADGILLLAPGFFGVIKTADCLPVIAVDSRKRAVCALHAGWRGTRDRIVRKGLARFLDVTGSDPEDVVVAFGPSIRQCCYEVGPEVVEDFRKAGHDVDAITSGRLLDVVAANRLQAESLGITTILDSGMCTGCRTDLFYSYRREGVTGRLWAIAGFR